MDNIVQLFKPKASNLQKAIEEIKEAEPNINSIVIIYNTVNDKDESFIHHYWHSGSQHSSAVLGLIEYMKHIIIKYMLEN